MSNQLLIYPRVFQIGYPNKNPTPSQLWDWASTIPGFVNNLNSLPEEERDKILEYIYKYNLRNFLAKSIKIETEFWQDFTNLQRSIIHYHHFITSNRGKDINSNRTNTSNRSSYPRSRSSSPVRRGK